MREFMEDANTLCYAVNGVICVLSARSDLSYDRLYVFSQKRPLKLAQSYHLDEELRFKQRPRIASCEETGDIYLFDLHYLYKQNNDFSFTRLNKGVFLGEPGELAALSCSPTELVAYCWLPSRQLSRLRIAFSELEEIAWTGANIPLSFYFNK